MDGGYQFNFQGACPCCGKEDGHENNMYFVMYRSGGERRILNYSANCVRGELHAMMPLPWSEEGRANWLAAVQSDGLLLTPQQLLRLAALCPFVSGALSGWRDKARTTGASLSLAATRPARAPRTLPWRSLRAQSSWWLHWPCWLAWHMLRPTVTSQQVRGGTRNNTRGPLALLRSVRVGVLHACLRARSAAARHSLAEGASVRGRIASRHRG